MMGEIVRGEQTNADLIARLKAAETLQNPRIEQGGLLYAFLD
jgi:hypothetical protein